MRSVSHVALWGSCRETYCLPRFCGVLSGVLLPSGAPVLGLVSSECLAVATIDSPSFDHDKIRVLPLMYVANVTAQKPCVLPLLTAEVADLLTALDYDFTLGSPFVVVVLVLARHCDI